ncbi:MAG: exodeoxyribonuclease III [Cycloclasticus sp.]|nr:exodeoxyribonuclease III [Cycloclasticus sp.]MBQ0789860.1 exodeoxyribonuclease III [Cycloclasticus sp.]
MKIVSININGIRAGERKGFFDWMKQLDADVLCLQEIKAQEDQLSTDVFYPSDYHCYYHPAEKKGYSGVAIFSKQKPDSVNKGLGWPDFDCEGRFIEATFGDLSVSSLYMPSGSSKEERQDFKYELMARLLPVLREKQADSKKHIICGDWNIAHKKIDIKNWRGNQKNSGFLPEERAWMDQLFDDEGWGDAFRLVNQEAEQYTWWSNRGQAWANNTGWRIDYQVISDNLKGTVLDASIYKEQRFSDHAPLIIDYDITP